MSEINHADMVGRLVSKASLDMSSAHLLHMAVGISINVAELSMSDKFEKTIDSLGNIEFYLEGLRQALDIERLDTIQRMDKVLGNHFTMVSAAGDILDLVKVHTIDGDTYNTEAMLNALALLEVFLETRRKIADTNYELVLQANVDKLSTVVKQPAKIVPTGDKPKVGAVAKKGPSKAPAK